MSTGIRGLDTILGGGLIARRLYVVKGPPGAGKSVLSAQLSFHRARAGEQVVYVTMLTESHSSLLENLTTLEFFSAALAADRITFVSGFRALDEGGLHGLYKLMRGMIQKTGSRLLVLDGIVGTTDRMPSPEGLRRFVRNIATVSTRSTRGCRSSRTWPTA
ncbi:MAG TPA: RAD55 family ATPase [Kofleriaceae bacterium]